MLMNDWICLLQILMKFVFMDESYLGGVIGMNATMIMNYDITDTGLSTKEKQSLSLQPCLSSTN